MTELSPTPRTTLTREKERGVSEREQLMALLAEGLIAHIGVTVGEGPDAHPVVLPVAYAVDPDGPDPDGTLYVHGSVAAGWLRRTHDGERANVCVTVTALDGLVLARSAFNHSMNYRCGVVIGPARLVDDPEEKARALDLIVDHVVPGPGGRAAAQHPQGAGGHLGARGAAARGLAQDPRRRTRWTTSRTSTRATGPVTCRCGWSPPRSCPTRPHPGPCPSTSRRRAEGLGAPAARVGSPP